MPINGRTLLVAFVACIAGCGGGNSSVAGNDAGQPSDGSSDGGADFGLGRDDDASGADQTQIADALRADVASGDGAQQQPEVPIGQMPRPMIWQLEQNSPYGASAVGGTGDTDIWAVSGPGIASHTTGDGHWMSRDIGGPNLNGIYAAAINNVYVSGRINAVYHWDGSGTWDRQVLDSGVLLGSIWASGPNDLFAVGTGLFRSKGDRVWKYEPIPAAESEIFFIWGSGPNDIYVVDGLSNILHSTGDGVWTRQPAPGKRVPSFGLWGSGPNDVYALAGGLIMHSTGDGQWVQQEIVGQTDKDSRLSIWGSGPNDLYVGGSQSCVFRSTGDGLWHRERLLAVDDPHILSITAIGGTSNNVYLAGGVGLYHGRPAP